MKTRLLKRLRKEANEGYRISDLRLRSYEESGMFMTSVVFDCAPLKIYMPRWYGENIVLSCNDNLPVYREPEKLKIEWWRDQIIEKKRRYVLRHVELMRGKAHRYIDMCRDVSDIINQMTKV